MSPTELSRTSHAFARFTEEDLSPQIDPGSPFWLGAPSVIAEADTYAQLVPGHRTKIYAQWSHNYLYFLFACAYQGLHLRPSPVIHMKTQELWNWDVAEVFVGSDFEHIRRYKEFELSPQGEWLDIAVDLDQGDGAKQWLWNSGLSSAARISAEEKIWYGFLRIPYPSIDSRPAAAGNQLRINFYRSQGPAHAYHEIAWQPTYQATFHVPESFGILELLAPGAALPESV